MCVSAYMRVFSQVMEYGRERYSFDPWNKERREGKGESSGDRRLEGDGQRDSTEEEQCERPKA